MTVRELLGRMDAVELQEWKAFAQLEPFGELRADYRAGIMASTFYNMFRGKKTRAGKVEDFMPFLKAEQKRNDPQKKKLSAKIRSFFKGLKG